MYQKQYHIFLVGIGGIGMSSIAELLLSLGYRVSGSDLKPSAITRHLEDSGAVIHEGHSKEAIKNVDVVVTSTAIPNENPEVSKALEMSIPVIPRAQMLAELMRSKYAIAVAGAHGKTSTTSITASILEVGGLDPTVVIGGILKKAGTNSILGKGKFMVVEADESDGSFLMYSPSIAIITNIDREHLDFYSGIDDIKLAFLDFIHRIPFYGRAILCVDNENVRALLPKIRRRYITYGTSKDAHLRAENITFQGDRSSFDLFLGNKNLGMISSALPGDHNITNALAAIAAGLELGISMDDIKQALKTSEGVKRRLEFKGEEREILVMDDYAHHPTEIVTTIGAAKKSWPDKSLFIVFQPHRFTRTQALFNEFATAFSNADHLIVLPVYSAGEQPIPSAEGKTLAMAIRRAGHENVTYMDTMDTACDFLNDRLKGNDLLITMGAGDVYKLGENLLKELSAEDRI